MNLLESHVRNMCVWSRRGRFLFFRIGRDDVRSSFFPANAGNLADVLGPECLY
jgi:hypothetical protein